MVFSCWFLQSETTWCTVILLCLRWRRREYVATNSDVYARYGCLETRAMELEFWYRTTIPKAHYSECLLFGLGLGLGLGARVRIKVSGQGLGLKLAVTLGLWVRVRIGYVRNSGPELKFQIQCAKCLNSWSVTFFVNYPWVIRKNYAKSATWRMSTLNNCAVCPNLHPRLLTVSVSPMQTEFLFFRNPRIVFCLNCEPVQVSACSFKISHSYSQK